jgi:hypothetical protein
MPAIIYGIGYPRDWLSSGVGGTRPFAKLWLGGMTSDMVSHLCICIALHHHNLAAEYFFVMLERRFALAIKAKICHKVGRHVVGPFLVCPETAV